MTQAGKTPRAARVFVEGRVQGVGYRFFAARAARDLGIGGWVRNLPDGRVEALVRADVPEALEAFLARLREGPPHSRVERVEVRSAAEDTAAGEEPGGPRGFEIRG